MYFKGVFICLVVQEFDRICTIRGVFLCCQKVVLSKIRVTRTGLHIFLNLSDLLVYMYFSNYAPTMAIQALANEYGCQQALWLYGEEHNLTEVGAMNLFTLWINEQGGNRRLTELL